MVINICVSQFCDEGYYAIFHVHTCKIVNANKNTGFYGSHIDNDCYALTLLHLWCAKLLNSILPIYVTID